MEILKFESYVVKTKIREHESIKKDLLEMISESESESFSGEKANISKLDWSKFKDVNRIWIHYFYPHLKPTLDEIYKKMGFDSFTLEALWYQQYETSAHHGWHIHGSNFTSVYYLELPKDSPATELILPSLDKKIKVDVEEGDVIFFPSFIIHRGPVNTSSERKTIISFNTTAEKISDDVESKLNLLP